MLQLWGSCYQKWKIIAETFGVHVFAFELGCLRIFFLFFSFFPFCSQVVFLLYDLTPFFLFSVLYFLVVLYRLGSSVCRQPGHCGLEISQMEWVVTP